MVVSPVPDYSRLLGLGNHVRPLLGLAGTRAHPGWGGWGGRVDWWTGGRVDGWTEDG